MMAKKEIIKKTVKNEDETVMEQPTVEAPANVEAEPENESEDVDVMIEQPCATEKIVESIEKVMEVLDGVTEISVDNNKEKPQPTPTRVKFWNGYSY